MKTIEELKLESKQAKQKSIEDKKNAKNKPKESGKKRKHISYADGGEEQWDSAIAPPLRSQRKDGSICLETYRLPTGQWSFSPKQDGPISLYHAAANGLYTHNANGLHAVSDALVWFYTTDGVVTAPASHPDALRARRRFEDLK